MYKYIGIDTIKATLDVYDGEKSYKFDNSKKGFAQIRKLSSKKEELCLIFEPTGIYSHALVQYCHKHNIKAFTVGSKEARDYARSIKQRSKTDKIDAKVLYRYHTQIDPDTLTVPSIDKKVKKITQRYNVLKQYEKAIGALENLIEATTKDDKPLIRSLRRQIFSIQKEANKIEKEIEELLTQDEKDKERFNNLLTIPGVGKKSALAILLELMRYPDAKSGEMAALMGLDPVLRDSGVFKGRSRISKQGGERLRRKLYMPTLSAIRYNDRLNKFYQGLISRGKSKNLQYWLL